MKFPKITAYLLSYLFIINLWFGHNQLFKLFDKVDNRMLWLNNFLLLSISFTPYPISLISEYPNLSAGVFMLGILAVINPILYVGIFNRAYYCNYLHRHLNVKKLLQLRKTIILLIPISAFPLIFVHKWPMVSTIIYIGTSITGMIVGSKANFVTRKN